MQFKISVRHAGIAAVVLSVLMGIVLVSYDESLKKLNEYVHKDCGMPDDICPVKNAVPVQALPAFLNQKTDRYYEKNIYCILFPSVFASNSCGHAYR